MKLLIRRRPTRIFSVLVTFLMLGALLLSSNLTAFAATGPSTDAHDDSHPDLQGDFNSDAHDDADSHDDSARKMVGYFIQWGIYRGTSAYYVNNLVTSGSVSKLTHLNYAFANVDAKGLCASFDPWADYQVPMTAANSVDGLGDQGGWGTFRGNFHQLQELKAKNPGLKILISIGGWTGSANFSQAAMTPAGRQALVSSCLNMYIKGNFDPSYSTTPVPGIFDGIDLDWEYPATAGNTTNYSPQDTVNYTLLLREFRTQLKAYGATTGKHYLLTAALPAGPAKYSLIQLNKIAKYLDYASLMGYDYHGAWETTTNFNAPVFPSPKDPAASFHLNLAESVVGYLHAGFPKHKLVIGMPFYAHAWTNVPAGNNFGLYQSAPTTSVGTLDNAGYKAVIASPGYSPDRVHFDAKTQSFWLYVPNTNGALGDFVSFDPPASLAHKGALVSEFNLAGAMFWDFTGDTADGQLISALSKGLHHDVNSGDN